MDKLKITGADLIINQYQLTESEISKAKSEWKSYIDGKYKTGYSEETTCTVEIRDNEFMCVNFGITPNIVSMYGKKPSDIKKCKVTIIEDDVHMADHKFESKICYYGWIDYNGDDSLKYGVSLIQPCRNMFTMQFPGGGDREIAVGHGKIVILKVELI